MASKEVEDKVFKQVMGSSDEVVYSLKDNSVVKSIPPENLKSEGRKIKIKLTGLLGVTTLLLLFNMIQLMIITGEQEQKLRG